MKTRIGLLFGGVSTEHEVSLRSARCIYEAFDHSQYEIIPIGIDRLGRWHFLDKEQFLLSTQAKELSFGEVVAMGHVPAVKEVAQSIDVVFPIIHGKHGEDGALQGLLTLLNIPYVGPDILSSSIAMDKDMSKRVVQSCGISVARYVSFRSWNEIDPSLWSDFSFPLFVKPARTGSSIGVSRISSQEEIETAIDKAFQYDDKIVIEEGIDGLELEVSVLGNETIEVSCPGRVVPKDSYYSFENKCTHDGASFEIPAHLDRETSERVMETAKKAYKALDCEGMARIDLFLGRDGTIYFNEANTLPGFTPSSLYPILWEASGKSYGALLSSLVDLAQKRHARKNRLRAT